MGKPKSTKKDTPKPKKKVIPKIEKEEEDDQKVGLPDVDFKKFLGCGG